ncbi:MAG: hypothetical protein GWM88_06645 [Pseudomonadales bacterium]|nr:protein BatD [Pseudomonadales bacterium]NIX07701.1 hypothetical protein [Pseudomonadales bacterium]
MLRLTLLVGLLGTAVLANGATAQPIVRVEVDPESVRVGESTELKVTVLVPTWFARPPVYPAFELANAITRLPPDSSYPTSERVGGETWSGIVRNYRFYPLLGARYRLPGETIKVTYANPGSVPLTAEVPVPEISIRGVVPRGAEDLEPYLAGTRLTLSRSIQGNADQLAVGEAVVVRHITELDGLPAMFLPPLLPGLRLDGVSVYADTPDVGDGPPARREDRLTLVFDSPGTFTLPAIELFWWNTNTSRIETAAVKAVTFSVTGPVTAAPQPDSSLPGWLQTAAVIVVAVLTLGLAWWKAAPIVTGLALSARQARRRSESYAFGQLRQAIRTGDAAEIYSRLLVWLDRLEAGLQPRIFASAYGDDRLGKAIASLNAHLYGRNTGPPAWTELARTLTGARRRFLRTRGQKDSRVPSVPPLNP